MYEGKYYLIDCSIEQANRPHKGIILKPIFCKIEKEFLQGKALYLKINDNAIRYIADVTNRSFTNSPDWIFKSRRERIVNSLINLLKN